MVVHRHTAGGGEGEEVSKVVLWLFTGIQREEAEGEEVSKVVLQLFTGIQREEEKVKKSLK